MAGLWLGEILVWRFPLHPGGTKLDSAVRQFSKHYVVCMHTLHQIWDVTLIWSVVYSHEKSLLWGNPCFFTCGEVEPAKKQFIQSYHHSLLVSRLLCTWIRCRYFSSHLVSSALSLAEAEKHVSEGMMVTLVSNIQLVVRNLFTHSQDVSWLCVNTMCDTMCDFQVWHIPFCGCNTQEWAHSW